MLSSKFPHSSRCLYSTSWQKFSTSRWDRWRRNLKKLPLMAASKSERISLQLFSLLNKSPRLDGKNRPSRRNNCSGASGNKNKYPERSKIIPKLIYLHNPWKYLVTRFNLLKLYLFWDREFSQREFIYGSKQAAVVMTDIIRNQNATRVSQFTTPIGFQQITRDMILSRKDIRLQLIQFELEHLRRAIPMKVIRRKKFGRKYCFIDMLFVGLRNTKDFDNTEDATKVNDIIRRIDTEFKIPYDVTSAPHRIVFAEIFIRFRKDYSDQQQQQPENLAGVSAISTDSDWSVSFYKILAFDVINYSPK